MLSTSVDAASADDVAEPWQVPWVNAALTVPALNTTAHHSTAHHGQTERSKTSRAQHSTAQHIAARRNVAKRRTALHSARQRCTWHRRTPRRSLSRWVCITNCTLNPSQHHTHTRTCKQRLNIKNNNKPYAATKSNTELLHNIYVFISFRLSPHLVCVSNLLKYRHTYLGPVWGYTFRTSTVTKPKIRYHRCKKLTLVLGMLGIRKAQAGRFYFAPGSWQQHSLTK